MANLPNATKRRAGRKVEQAGNVEHFPERLYRPADLPMSDTANTTTHVDFDIGGAVQTDRLSSLKTSDRVKEIIEYGRVRGETKKGDDSRSAWEWEAICSLLRDKIAPEVILGLLVDPFYGIAERVREKPDPLQYARKEIARATAHVGDSGLSGRIKTIRSAREPGLSSATNF